MRRIAAIRATAGALGGAVRASSPATPAGCGRSRASAAALGRHRLGQLARHARRSRRERVGDGVLVDVGSTTTDLIALQRTAASRARPQRRRSGWPAASWSTTAWCARRCARWRGASLSRRDDQRDERVLRHQRRRLPPDRRARSGARPAPERRQRGKDAAGDAPAAGAHDRPRRARRRGRATGSPSRTPGAPSSSPSSARPRGASRRRTGCRTMRRSSRPAAATSSSPRSRRRRRGRCACRSASGAVGGSRRHRPAGRRRPARRAQVLRAARRRSRRC